MIWSIDQDDNNYRCAIGMLCFLLITDTCIFGSALKALYPNIDAAAGGVMQGGGSCKVTDCGVKKCDPGYTLVIPQGVGRKDADDVAHGL